MAADTFHCIISDGIPFIRKSTSFTMVRGSNLKWGIDFLHLSRLALEPTQPPVQWVLGIFPRSKVARVWH